MTNLETLHALISKNGNCVNLGRTMVANHLELYQWVIDNTSFLLNPTFYERVYCIINNLSAAPVNEDGTLCNFVNLFHGYRIPKKIKIQKVKKGRSTQLPKTTLEAYLHRNKVRNANLYNADMVEGIDFVMCPHTNTRKTMIEAKYITSVLGMTVDEYDKLYPNIQKIATSRMEKVKEGLQKIDSETGLTKHKIAQIKSKEILSKIGDDGLSGYKRKGKKTRETHMNTIDEFGRNGYRKQADNRLTTILPNGLTVEQHAHIKQRETIISTNCASNGGASKISKKWLAPILILLDEYNQKYYFDKSEYGIKDMDIGCYYFYDVVIPELNMAIEYQSSAWHSNPAWSKSRWDKWMPPKGARKTAEEVLQYDYNKARALYKFRNIVTYYVWEDSAQEDIEGLLCLLKTQLMKF